VNIARNRAIKTLALPSGKTHLIFADNDIVPSRQTDSFFQADADVVGAMFDLSDMASWSDPEMLHFGLVRFDRHVLAAIQPPWFQRVYTSDGAALVKCGCLYLLNTLPEYAALLNFECSTSGFVSPAGGLWHWVLPSWYLEPPRIVRRCSIAMMLRKVFVIARGMAIMTAIRLLNGGSIV